MKKVALSLLAFALLGAGAFAEDAAPAPTLKFSGYLNAGINADFAENGTPSTYLYSNDEGWKDGSTFKLVGTYDATTWGYKFRLRARPIDFTDTVKVLDTNGDKFTATKAGAQSSPLLNYAYGWYKPFDGAKILAGKLADATISGLDDEGDTPFYYLEGAQIVYTISGLSVSGAVGKRLSKVTNDGLLSAFGAKYSLPKTFTVEAHATTGYDAKQGGLVALDTSKVGGYAVTASLDAVDGLSLAAGYNVYNVPVTAYSFFDVVGSYTIDKLTVAATAYDHIDTTWFDITPKVTYAVTDALTVGTKVEFISADATDDYFGDENSKVFATYIPAVIATYVVGGATTNAYVGYDVTAKVTKTYLDFAFSF